MHTVIYRGMSLSVSSEVMEELHLKEGQEIVLAQYRDILTIHDKMYTNKSTEVTATYDTK